MREFVGDVRLAAATWRSTPLLPVFSAVIALLQEALVLLEISSGSIAPVWLGSTAVTIFRIGSVGTERIWYLRTFRGQIMPPSTIWRLSWSFVGPYLRLGVLVFGPIFTYALIVALAAGRAALQAGTPVNTSLPAWFYVSLSVLVILADFIMTFATPAVAYTTRSARTALRISWQMITGFWPATAAYVVFPPLAILLVSQANSQGLNIGLALLLTAATTLLNLLLKGATAAFYLRHHERILTHPPATRG